MSYITNVMVIGASEKNMEPVQAWLREHDTQRQQQFRQINMDAAGGSKWFTDKVWAAAFNYMPHELEDLLKNPDTWGHDVLGITVVVDGENHAEAYVFADYSEDRYGESDYRPAMARDHEYNVVRP